MSFTSTICNYCGIYAFLKVLVETNVICEEFKDQNIDTNCNNKNVKV